MAWEIDIIRWLQGSNSAPLNYVFWLITQLGTELVFIAAVMVYYWCISKKEGYRLINLFMVSQVMTGIIKVMVRRTRPYATGKVQALMEQTDGYSFPSGHSNNIAVVCTHSSLYARKSDKRLYVFLTSVIVILLVMLSRMYLGQHYLTDVVAGAAIGIFVASVGYYVFGLFKDNEEKIMYFIVPCCVILVVAALIMLIAKGETFDSVTKVAGTYMAASIGYFVEKRYVKSEVAVNGKCRACRLALGFIIVAAAYILLKLLFGLTDNAVASLLLGFIRYFIIGILVTLLMPMLFNKLKI